MLKANVIKKDGFIVLNCPYAEFYVPKQYLEKDLAVDACYICLGLLLVQRLGGYS